MVEYSKINNILRKVVVPSTNTFYWKTKLLKRADICSVDKGYDLSIVILSYKLTEIRMTKLTIPLFFLKKQMFSKLMANIKKQMFSKLTAKLSTKTVDSLLATPSKANCACYQLTARK